MLKILIGQWDKNKDLLKEELSKIKNIEYRELVKLTFNCIFNNNLPSNYKELDIENITEIDDGNYQGTLLYVIPFNVYQPAEYDYLMTYVGYGSCSGCDSLLSILGYKDNEKLSAYQINELMSLCKDIITDTIKPFNNGWRKSDLFLEVGDL